MSLRVSSHVHLCDCQVDKWDKEKKKKSGFYSRTLTTFNHFNLRICIVGKALAENYLLFRAKAFPTTTVKKTVARSPEGLTPVNHIGINWSNHMHSILILDMS